MNLNTKYELLHRLGHGAGGSVYLARHRTLNVMRAVKIISKACDDAHNIYQQALIIRNIRHPGIPLIYDIEETDDNIYIFEEYINGRTLTQYVRDNHPGLADIVTHGICLCSILNYLHCYEDGIFHLDLKPDNVIIDTAGQLWLIDYDNSATGGSTLPNCRGSRGYSAPEQYYSRRPDAGFDIYGLGMLILYMATGDIQSNVLNVHHQSLIPIIKRCVHHNPILRYRSVAAVQKDLERILTGNATEASAKSLEIFVAKTHQGVGATQFCLGLCSFLNRNGITAVCVNHGGIEDYAGIISDFSRNAQPHMLGEAVGVGSLWLLPTAGLKLNDTFPHFQVVIHDGTPMETEPDITVCSWRHPYTAKTSSHIIWNLCSSSYFYNCTRDLQAGAYHYRMPLIYDYDSGSTLFDNMCRKLCNDMFPDSLTLPRITHKKGGMIKQVKTALLRLLRRSDTISCAGRHFPDKT